jgi:hypothetical protein
MHLTWSSVRRGKLSFVQAMSRIRETPHLHCCWRRRILHVTGPGYNMHLHERAFTETSNSSSTMRLQCMVDQRLTDMYVNQAWGRPKKLLSFLLLLCFRAGSGCSVPLPLKQSHAQRALRRTMSQRIRQDMQNAGPVEYSERPCRCIRVAVKNDPAVKGLISMVA